MLVVLSAVVAMNGCAGGDSEPPALPVGGAVATFTECRDLRAYLRGFRDDMEQAARSNPTPVPFGFGGFGPDLSYVGIEPLTGEPDIVEAAPLAVDDRFVVYVNERGRLRVVERESRSLVGSVEIATDGFAHRLLLAGDRVLVVSTVPSVFDEGLTYEPILLTEVELPSVDIVDSVRIDGGYREAALVGGEPVLLTWSQPFLAATGGGAFFGPMGVPMGGVGFESTDEPDAEVDVAVDDEGSEVPEPEAGAEPEEAEANEDIADWVTRIELGDGTDTRPACDRVLLPSGGGRVERTSLLSHIGPGLDIDSVAIAGGAGGIGYAAGTLALAANVSDDDELEVDAHATLYLFDVSSEGLVPRSQVALSGQVGLRRGVSIVGDVVRAATADVAGIGAIETVRFSGDTITILGRVDDIGGGQPVTDVRFGETFAVASGNAAEMSLVDLTDPAAPAAAGPLAVGALGAVVVTGSSSMVVAGSDARLRGGVRGTLVVSYEVAGGEVTETARTAIEDTEPLTIDLRSLSIAAEGGSVVVLPWYRLGSPGIRVIDSDGGLGVQAEFGHADPAGQGELETDCELLTDDEVFDGVAPGAPIPQGLKVLRCEEDDRGGLDGYSCSEVTPDMVQAFGVDGSSLDDLEDGQRIESCFPNGFTGQMSRPAVFDGEVWTADISGIRVTNLTDPADATWIS